ncbi:uroporphyrinogen decarboxylase [Vitiosangium sp. GDMCC 1.1324]|uniref:uroporphyrinogen decarboxylase n=1 Tax=Vitiosangium sp. (strain GDMCC 1.1324) TaxID=2138576 RepID=UPI000D348C05|nr:uroporphyrinogen decarboxylase [Vitiosangium sp. GDMCC 1.1324]PTL75333.1 uroporphyrinogen decarboxylase [Vitiosangium sp. GDMCC 1.1324]
MNDRLLRAARRQPTDTTPVWLMRQAGRYLPEYRAVRGTIGFLDLCKNPDLAAEVTVQPITRLGVDAAIIFSDILIPVEAMGIELELGDKGPHFPNPVRTAADIERLGVPDPVQGTGFVAEAIRRTRRALNDSVPVIGFSGAPFTLAAYMVEGGGSKSYILIKRLLFEQPKLAHTLFQKLTDTLIPYLQMQVEAGASIVQIFDSWGGELSPWDYERFCIPYLTRMVKEVQAKGVPVIVFGTGMSNHLPLLKRTGADVIGQDWRTPIDEARRVLGPDVAVQGNLDPLHLFLPREELEQRVVDILRRAGPVGHIFNLGHGILPPTDPDAAKFLVDAVHKHGAALRQGT